MAITLGSILFFALLSVNGVAVLSEDRFLARIGWSASGQQGQFGQYGGDPYSQQGGEGPGIKARLINLDERHVRKLTVPLIAINIVVIVYLLILG